MALSSIEDSHTLWGTHTRHSSPLIRAMEGLGERHQGICGGVRGDLTDVTFKVCLEEWLVWWV